MTRTAPLALERDAWERGVERVAGLDETGRGPLAGPVVVAAVVLHPGQRFEGATDSKRLEPEHREELAGLIQEEAFACVLAAASTREVERLNVLCATHLAMRRVLARLDPRPEEVLVDGLRVPDLPPHRALVDGDLRCHSIACASIVAKVVRDRLMRRLHPRYPAYGWDRNKGYGTPEHVKALYRQGLTPHHRRTFTPVAQAELELEA